MTTELKRATSADWPSSATTHKPLFFTLDAEGKRRPWKDEDD